MFVLENCPYCIRARKQLKALMESDPRFGALSVTIIDEAKQPELADKADYYYVPTFYLGSQKKLEGALQEEQIRQLLEEAVQG